MSLWENSDPITSLNIPVPEWINQDISPYEVAAIIQNGCASGAYMPAVTYHQALETMGKHGDNILQYIEDTQGELPHPDDNQSWSGMAVLYLSYAVDLWAVNTEGEIAEAISANKTTVDALTLKWALRDEPSDYPRQYWIDGPSTAPCSSPDALVPIANVFDEQHAHLILASPDLLEVVQAIHDMVEGGDTPKAIILALTSAVITKATLK